MENLLSQLKDEFKHMLTLQSNISELNARLLYVGNMNDKRNYNEELATKMSNKSRELNHTLCELKTKWGI